MILKNSVEAGEMVQALLANKDVQTTALTHQIGGGRVHVELIDINSHVSHYIKYSKTPFLKFGSFFKQWKGEHGDSLNDKVVQHLESNTVLYFAYPDRIYTVTLEKFIEPSLIRTTSWGDITWSFPLSAMDMFAE